MEHQTAQETVLEPKFSRVLALGLAGILGGCAAIYEVPSPPPPNAYATVCTNKISHALIDLFSYGRDTEDYKFIDKREFTDEQGRSCLEYHFQKIKR